MKTRKISQKDVAALLGLPGPSLSEMLAGKRRPSRNMALELEKKSGVGRFVWLYGNPSELREEIERALGRTLNFGRGRLPGEEAKQ